MRRKFFVFLLTVLFAGSAIAASKVPNRFINKSLYENVYPYTLNNTRQDTTNMTTGINFQNQMKTSNNSSTSSFGKRRVIKRNTKARSATNAANMNTNRTVVPRSNIARSGVSGARNIGRKSSASNVVARGVTKTGSRYTSSDTNKTSSSKTAISSQRCFSDYKECMESFCEREDAPYNRCYCSAKLAQIDSKYQNKIDNLMQQIIKLKYNVDATDEEIKEYWDETIGSYTGDNPWVNIDNALNIDWSTTESRVRGQNAFVTGHKYCVNHLKACYSMASNMRDAYKSEIARDCEVYEKSLQRIQSAAESVIENYDD
ncbi:MAG: hypothetical protein IKN73_01335 [Alphaproteobacteria bacterium]|nr:hypothetical protein [Alphaproteobacteria bacterium]